MQRRYVLALIDRRIAQIEHGDTPLPEATSGRLPGWLSRIFGEP